MSDLSPTLGNALQSSPKMALHGGFAPCIGPTQTNGHPIICPYKDKGARTNVTRTCVGAPPFANKIQLLVLPEISGLFEWNTESTGQESTKTKNPDRYG